MLLVGAVMAILPTVTGYTSLDGTVNARISIVSAPIDGTVTSTAPKIGIALQAGAELLGIRNDRIVRTAEIQMEAELESAKKRRTAIDDQRAQLAALRQELQARRQDYQQASIQNLTHEIAIRRQRIDFSGGAATSGRGRPQQKAAAGDERDRGGGCG